MKNKKQSGSYYTPPRLADLVADYCLSKIKPQKNISVLEPSAGDGSFINAISNSKQLSKFENIKITAVEQNNDELSKIKNLTINSKIKLKAIHSDYLNFHYEQNILYSLYIGNPPYVKKTLLNNEQKLLCKNIHIDKNLSDRSINNIWTSFLISGLSKLVKDGILALILPLELLQVKFTQEIRNLLKLEFDRIEIFTFNELQFQECKGQDTVLLIGYKKHLQKGTFYTNIVSLDQMESNNFEFSQNAALATSDKKWTHHFITPEEYGFLEAIKERLKNVTDIVTNKAGIVTAANSFFIVNNEIIEKYSFQNFAKPIVQKGLYVNGSISFNNDDFKNLIKDNKPCYLLDFNELSEDLLTPQLKEYFEIGVSKNLHIGFKAKQRERWYKVPNIAEIPQAFFFKRAHDYPKLIKNDAKVRVTDSAYKIHINEGYSLDNFIFSFYNSLTLTFAELEGRYYGGGVLELTPNEFRTLPIPYVNCNDFDQFRIKFENKNSIEEILNQNNFQILNSSIGLNIDEINRIEHIRRKLINKRKKND